MLFVFGLCVWVLWGLFFGVCRGGVAGYFLPTAHDVPGIFCRPGAGSARACPPPRNRRDVSECRYGLRGEFAVPVVLAPVGSRRYVGAPHAPVLRSSDPCAGVAEPVDAPGLGPGGLAPWGFESLRPHHVFSGDARSERRRAGEATGISGTPPYALV